MSSFSRYYPPLFLAFILLAGCAGQGRPPGQQSGRVAGADPAQPESAAAWVQTGGPAGGYINDLAVDPENPDRLYAAGSPLGLYVTGDRGRSWSLLPFPERKSVDQVEIDPHDPATLYCTLNNFSRSDDGGRTWTEINRGFGDYGYVTVFLLHPETPGVLYTAVRRFDGQGGKLLRSEDRGGSWGDISGPLDDREDGFIAALACTRGRLFAAVNYGHDEERHGGKLFVSDDGGRHWRNLQFGGNEKRYIFSVFANPHAGGEIWVTEGPLFNESIPQPMIYRSTDSGRSWKAMYFRAVRFDSTQVRAIGAGVDGRVYLAAGAHLLATPDGGKTFTDITPDRTLMDVVDYRTITVNPQDPQELFLPLRATGVAHSGDGGKSWELSHEGIIATNINLLAVDPGKPGTVYAAAGNGEGTFRSDDYGGTWTRLNAGGIVHAFGDELLVDPSDPDPVWFISDVPFIHRSGDGGKSWEVVNGVYNPGGFNFNSVYALAPSSDPNMMYALNNGFGIYRGRREGEHWRWRFLMLSGVDYTYALAASPQEENLLLSGYSRKPFESAAKIRMTEDGGETWSTSLVIEGAEAVTSVVTDPNVPDRFFASSSGEAGGAVWLSRDRGRSWQQPNPYFNFCTIHAFAAGADQTAYAGVWGGGTYKTTDGGGSWELLPDPRLFSAAAIALDPKHPDTVYAADRTRPVVYRSSDGGGSWSEFFNAGPGYTRLMHVAVDPHSKDTVYVSALRPGHGGMQGSLFKASGGKAADISGGLERVVLTVTVDPRKKGVLYAVLHERGIARSIDGGRSWQDISGAARGLPDSGFSRLILDPGDPEVLYILGGCDVRSDTAESAGLDPDRVNGVYRSTDAGSSWRQLGRGTLGGASGAVKSLAFSSEGRLYAAAENGAYTSRDGGSTWIRVTGLPYETLGGLALQAGRDGERVYAYTNGAGLFAGRLESNGLVSWDQDASGEIPRKPATPVYFTQVLKDPRANNLVYASGYPGGIFKSFDGGRSWHEANFGIASFAVEDPLRQGYYALAISRSDPDVLYLGMFGKGVYRSTNGASTWYPVDGLAREMAGKKITALLVDAADARRVYVAADDGVYRTSASGRSWQNISAGLSSYEIRTLCQNAGGEIFAGSKGYGMFQWREKEWQALLPFGQWGVIWPMWDDRPLYQYTSLLIHPDDGSRLMLGTFPQGIYLSENGGKSWHESNVGFSMDGVFRLVHHPEKHDLVFAGTYNGINRSDDFGRHWQVADSGWPEEQWVFSIEFDPENPYIMYACSKNGENEGRGREDFHGIVMKSSDGGDSWSSIMSGLDPGQEFYEILVDRFDSKVLYLAAQEQGVMLSTDGGQNWRSWNEGLFNPRPGTNGNNVTRCLLLSADGSTLYFGSAGAGVFRRGHYR